MLTNSNSGPVIGGLYDPEKRTRREYKLDISTSRLHIGRHPAARLWFFETSVDGKPTIVAGGKARVELSIEYRPVAGEAETERSTTPNINESLTVLLEDGKQTMLSQSADPVTDRKVKVEAKMAVIR